MQLQQMMHMEWELSMDVEQSLTDRCSATGQSQLDALPGEWTDLGEIGLFFFLMSVEDISELHIFLCIE